MTNFKILFIKLIFFFFFIDSYQYDHFEMVEDINKHSIFDSAHTHSNLTIVGQEMDKAVAKWLNYLKLHKYQWFFNALSYLEIECIDEDNIGWFIAKANINSISKGAQKKICISTKTLRDRQQKLKDLLMVSRLR